MEPIAKPEDLPFDLARRAHEGTSFVPEQRAKQAQQAYADAVNGFYADMLELAKTDEQRAILDEQIQRYKTNYLSKFGDYLRSHSHVVSTMIAGPSNFPVARMEKRGQWADSKRDAFLEWEKHARAAVRRTLLEARTPEDKLEADWQALRKDISRSLATLHGIDTNHEPWDRPAFTNSIAGKIERLANNGEVDLVEKALAFIREYNERHKKPAFTARHKLWSFPGVASAARERLSADAETPSTVIATGEGYAIEKNPQADRVQIFFDEKPDAAMRAKLKASGWNFSPTNNAWQRKLTDAAIYSAKTIAGMT